MAILWARCHRLVACWHYVVKWYVMDSAPVVALTIPASAVLWTSRSSLAHRYIAEAIRAGTILWAVCCALRRDATHVKAYLAIAVTDTVTTRTVRIAHTRWGGVAGP